ncbi:MAG: NUDIX domain-containing protein, partial [Gemmatimonadetes bacterium]|nr:NUDIX domain-containing protein [Gemmatimonadota bacterium]
QNVHGSGSWSTPGGHLDYGESPEACAVREAKEETGVVVSHVTFRAITNDIFETDGRHYITVWMEGQHQMGEPVVNAPHEMSEVGWFRWDELPAPLFLSLENLLSGRCYPPADEESSG